MYACVSGTTCSGKLLRLNRVLSLSLFLHFGPVLLFFLHGVAAASDPSPEFPGVPGLFTTLTEVRLKDWGGGGTEII